jgi:hypothetical protein
MTNPDKIAGQPPTDEGAKRPLFRSAEKRQRSKDRGPAGVHQEGRLIGSAGRLLESLWELLPEEARQHQRNASRERLLAWRALIDARLAVLDRRQRGKAGGV